MTPTTGLPLAFIFDGLGGSEMVLVFLLVLMLFGGKKLPELARGLGKTMREVRKATSNVEAEIKRAIEEQPPAPRPPVANTLPTDMDLAQEPQPQPAAPPAEPPPSAKPPPAA